jgi:hypothetical protein
MLRFPLSWTPQALLKSDMGEKFQELVGNSISLWTCCCFVDFKNMELKDGFVHFIVRVQLDTRMADFFRFPPP